MDERTLKNQLINSYVLQQYQQQYPQQAFHQDNAPSMQQQGHARSVQVNKNNNSVQHHQLQPQSSHHQNNPKINSVVQSQQSTGYLQQHQALQNQFIQQQRLIEQQNIQYQQQLNIPPSSASRPTVHQSTVHVSANAKAGSRLKNAPGMTANEYQRVIRQPPELQMKPAISYDPPQPRAAPLPQHQQQHQQNNNNIDSNSRQGVLKSVELPDQAVLEEFKNQVRLWVEIDNSISKLRSAIKERNNVKKQLTDKVLMFMAKYNIEDLNTKDGSRLRYKVTQVKQPLTAKVIKERLAENFDNIQTTDDLETQIFTTGKVEKVSLRRLKKRTMEI
jgi:hypothetical protein